MKPKLFKSLMLFWTAIMIMAVSLIVADIESAYALFTVSATPYDGSYDLRFDKISQLTPIDAEKEVTITINSDIGRRYQVVQTLSQPLVSTEGKALPINALNVYTLRGSNTTGTLGLDSEVPVRTTRTVVYTSDTAGTGDSFTVVYRLKHSLVSTSGLYRGRLSFSLEPIDSTQSPHTTNLDVEVDIEVPSEIAVTTMTGGKTIELESPQEAGLPTKVAISVQGQRQGQYKILQSLDSLVNRDGEELTKGVNFSVKSKEGGILAQPGEGPLKRGQGLLYTSDSFGSDDEIEITYSLKEGLIAGTYRGSISYYIEPPFSTKTRSGLIDTLVVDVNIEPIFELKVRSEDDGAIAFKNLKEGEVQEFRVLIEIKSNLAKPYQVSQYASSLLTSKDGKVIPKDYFKFSTQQPDEKEAVITKGILKFPTKSSVEKDETVIFISNKSGESDIFRVVYELTGPRDQWGGDYTTGIHYSLSQIEIR